MIIDYLEHINQYSQILPSFAEGVAFALSLLEKPVGRYEQGDIFAMVQEGETTPITEGDFEAHRIYADVQMMLEGSEMMEWEEIQRLSVTVPYSHEKDAELLSGEGQMMHITKGMFYVVFPSDAHKPCKYKNHPSKYRKIVLKLKMPKA